MFSDAADRGAIGGKLYYQANAYFHAKVSGFRDNTDIHIKLQESYLIFSIIFFHETDKD